jgi:hypothetical protein
MNSLVVTLAPEEITFTKQYAELGFSGESEVVSVALRLLQEHLGYTNEALHMEHSANLYAEIYSEDSELRELTASACMVLPSEFSS